MAVVLVRTPGSNACPASFRGAQVVFSQDASLWSGRNDWMTHHIELRWHNWLSVGVLHRRNREQYLAFHIRHRDESEMTTRISRVNGGPIHDNSRVGGAHGS